MIEADWLGSDSPSCMLRYLCQHDPGSPRKLGLYAVACFRRLWHFLDSDSRRHLETFGRYLEGQASRSEISHAVTKAHENWMYSWDGCLELLLINLLKIAPGANIRHLHWSPGPEVVRLIENLMSLFEHIDRNSLKRGREREIPNLENRCQDWLKAGGVKLERWYASGLARDIFHGPCRRVFIRQRWRTSRVLALAEHIYSQREFHLMPNLANELWAAGCDDFVILDHCTRPGFHVRGCWLLDSLLLKF